MKRAAFYILLQSLAAICTAQVMMTSSAHVQFFSKTPIENISASNVTVASVINISTDSIVVRIKNTAFKFKNSLMQSHFNENYMESSKFPLSTFRGKINEKISFTNDGTIPVSASGILKIHGVEKPVTISGTIKVLGKKLHLDAAFAVHTSDYKIDIPKLVFEKIAEEIEITMNADYTQTNK